MVIQVLLDNGQWTIARDYQANAFNSFIINQEELSNYNMQGYKFSIQRIYNKIILTRENGSIMPIFDGDLVKVFLIAHHQWMQARDYQIWAYRDFVYKNAPEVYYKSNGSTNLDPNITYVVLDIPNLEPDIVFRMSRNDNGTIFYEKNNINKTKVRISDNINEQRYYLNYVMRLTNQDMVVNNNPTLGHISVPVVIPTGLNLIETNNDDIACVVCNIYKKNIKYLPCNHIHTCSHCTKHIMDNGLLICSICRAVVNKIEKL